MISLATTLILLALAAVPLSWLLPRAWALDGVAAWTALALAILAPQSALLLIASACLVPLALRWAERAGTRAPAAAALVALLVGGLVFSRLSPGLGWVGVAYSTLRHIHVVADWWMGRISAPTMRAHLRYQLFLPVLVAGPIHRLQNFERQSARRRWEPQDFLSGLERLLFGALMAHLLGGWMTTRLALRLDAAMDGANAFLRDWAASAMDWIALYFEFSGYTSIALGASLMIGLRLEENFNRPWAARSLIDFWTRWHMTLSNWALDYVFRPVMSVTRNPVAGVFAAILAIGLWHDFSLYYVLWSFWQTLGVVLARVIPTRFLSARVLVVLAPILILGWLSLARPIIALLGVRP